MIPDPWPAPFAEAPVHATVSLPGSKSLTNRALILAALADGPSCVRGALRSRDTLLMAAALQALGAVVDTSGTEWTVVPGALGSGALGSGAAVTSIDVGLAGTVMRFVPPVAVLASRTVAFDGDAHMRQRPVGEILEALRTLGATIEGDGLPFTVHGTGAVRGGTVSIDASQSSQFVSALLLAGARYDAGLQIRHEGDPVPSLPHIEMTIQMLREHGVHVDDSTPNRWDVTPGPIKAVDRQIEPDLSNAAPFLALAAVTGGTVTVRDWPEQTTQAGDALREILTAFGCAVSWTPAGLSVTGPDQLQGVDLDLHDVGELAPAVAALAALATSPSRLSGIAHIRRHETDRLSALATELNRIGGRVTELDDGLVIEPAELHGGTWHTYADHRMATAGAIIGLRVPGVEVDNIETTAKTLPGFPRMWAEMLAASGSGD